jgi:hypothetical protein
MPYVVSLQTKLSGSSKKLPPYNPFSSRYHPPETDVRGAWDIKV